MDGGSANIDNSIIYYNYHISNNNPNYNLGGYSADNFFEYNITYSNVEGNLNNIINGVGNISTAPLFINLYDADYNLEYNSPCIDSGDPLFFDNDGTIVDMGANYFNQNVFFGDINFDNIINILDVILVIEFILEDYYFYNADINQDNILNILDVISIINLILN